jgi:hypothetical protein
MDKENEPSPNAVVDHYEDVDKMEPSTKPSKDIGAQFLAETTATEFTAKSEQKVIRRIDRVLLPVMFISFGLQYMDKALLNSAAQFGIAEDLGLYEIQLVDKIATLNLNKFSNVTLIFYWGYFVGGKSPSTYFGTILDEHNIGIAFPAVYLAQRLPTGKFSSVAIMIWGVVTISTAGVKTYPGFMVQRFSRSLPSHVLLLKLDRFFLGVCEAAISPAFSLITAMWYKPTEQPLRFAVWYASTGLGGLVGSIATWGIGNISL